MPNASQIGLWLKAARERQGTLSQEDAAHRVGITSRTLWAWEDGKNAPPADKFFALMTLYGAEAELPALLDKRRVYHTPRGSRPVGAGRGKNNNL